MSPGPLPVIFPRRLSDVQLAQYRAMAERMDEDEHCHVALLECVEELEKLYAEAVAQVKISQDVPTIEDLSAVTAFALQTRLITIVAKRLDPSIGEPWIGARTRAYHVVAGKSDRGVRAHLDRVVPQ